MKLVNLFLMLLTVILIGCSQTDIKSAPVTNVDSTTNRLLYYFKGQDKAIENGTRILNLVKAGKAGNGQEMWGQSIAFYGAITPPGGNANLMIADKVLLNVEIKPFKDVRPQAKWYDAYVLGKLRYIDQEMRIIYIEAKPEDYIVSDTM